MSELNDLKCPFCKRGVREVKMKNISVLTCGYNPCLAMGPIGKNLKDSIRKFKGLFKSRGVKQ